ncbi:MAG: UDP-N-acetylglucosamine 2-epimerase (hydrolyzing) [Planctomycetes bacterium]|nr:UDP-N-acetylglucosamine 2-epimerase (hydrolyzing) [Planctomycetota bacterium]
MRKVCVVTGNRAEYSRVRSVLRAVQAHPALELVLVVTGAHLLDRYGHTVDEIEADGFPIHEKVYLMVEGENPVTMAKSTGLGIIELATVFQKHQPDVVVAPTDRFETLSVAVAAAFLNIPVAHIQGGEVTGSIDESIRHAITKFAHLHFPATAESAARIVRMGEDPATVHMVGCPASDVLLETPLGSRAEVLRELNRLKKEPDRALDEEAPFLLVVQHPVTTEFGTGYEAVRETLEAVSHVGVQTVWLWPNADADSRNIVNGIRRWTLEHGRGEIYTYRHLAGPVFTRLVAHAACMVGNSSAGIRESCYFGTPVVNVGSRQSGRERGRNVLDVEQDRERIEVAARAQIQRGRYSPEYVYGSGEAGHRIAEVLATADLSRVQKRIAY